MTEHPFRETPPGRALRRARLIVNTPLLLAMAVMVLTGFRLGLSIHKLADADVNGGLVAMGITVLIGIGIWIGIALSVHPYQGKVARWLLGCGMSLILGLTLGSWP